MSRSKLARKLSLLAFLLAMGVAFAPRLVATSYAQEGDDDEGGGGLQLTDAQKKELDSIQKTQAKADEAIQGKDYEAGVKIYKKLCEKLDKSQLPEKLTSSPAFAQEKYLARYNYACCLSRTGAKEDAVKEFFRSVELGFFDWKHIASDDDLDALREMDSFKKAVEDGKKLEVERMVAQVKSGKSPCELSFEAEGTGDKKHTVERYKGKVLVVALISAERDEALAAEAEFLQKASDELKGKGLEVLGLVFGAEKDGLKDVAEKNKIKFHLAVGEPTESIKAAARTGATVFILDRTGKVRATASSINQAEVIIAAVKPLLDEAGGDDKKDDGKKDDGKKDDGKKDDKKKRDDF